MKFTSLFLSLPLGVLSAAKGVPYPPFIDTTWGGPVRLADNFNASSNSSGYDLVEATLVMPHLTLPRNPHAHVDEYTASFWIGLDGFLPSTGGVVHGLWQAGVIMSVWTNGTTGYSGFHEWVPSDPISLTTAQLTIKEGDHIRAVIKTTQAGYHGSTTLTNLNTSETFTHSQDAASLWRGPTFPAPGSSAEWVIEQGTYLNGTQYVFPNFGNAEFLDAKACKGSKCIVPGGAGACEKNTHMTVVKWNNTQTVYTNSKVYKDRVTISYVEEQSV